MSATALQRGQQDYLRRTKRAAIARVVTFERWLGRGSRTPDVPEIPSDADYTLARAAGKTNRGFCHGTR